MAGLFVKAVFQPSYYYFPCDPKDKNRQWVWVKGCFETKAGCPPMSDKENGHKGWQAKGGNKKAA
jgi:hypothetical protein